MTCSVSAFLEESSDRFQRASERGTLPGNHNRALEQFRMRGECG